MSASRERPDPPPPMTRAEFRAWAERRRGRYERIDGVVIEMAAERIGHVRAKTAAQAALARAIREAGLECEALGDGVTVEIGEDGDFEPDAMVNGGPVLGNEETVAPNPVVVVEVQSPCTGWRDETEKLRGYFSVPTVAHYILVNPKRRELIHFRRGEGEFSGRILGEQGGKTRLDPPGLHLDAAEFFQGLPREWPSR